jgi:hypothetical protein
LKSYQHRWPRPTPEQVAAAFEQALEWRSQWRAEMAQPNQELRAPPSRRDPDGRDGKDKGQFAAAIARAEFGRFYWKAGGPTPTRKPKAPDRAR